MTAGTKTAFNDSTLGDPHLSGRRVGQEFDRLNAASEVIEHDGVPSQQRVAIDGRLDALRRTDRQAAL